MKKENPNIEKVELTDEEKIQLERERLEKQKKKQKSQTVVKNIFLYLFLTIIAVFAFLPFYWMVISAVKSEIEYRQSVPTFFPQSFYFVQNFGAVLNKGKESGGSFIQMLVNTVTVGLVSTSLSLVLTIVTAYALARMNFKGKELLFTLMLGTMMIPGEMFTISNYITVSKWQWNNSFTVMIVPFMVSVYYIYLIRNNFKQIPNSLYQAAKVDGLSDMGYLIKVMVPLTAPTLVSVTLLKFIGTWNAYIWPRLVNSESWQLVTNWVTQGFADTGGKIYDGLYGTSMSLTTLKMAAVCMVSVPLFILFITCRKYIMKGVSKSGTKG